MPVLPFRKPEGLDPELLPHWPAQVSVNVVDSPKLVDSESAFCEKDRDLVAGEKTVLAKVTVFPFKHDEKTMFRTSRSVLIADPVLCRETVDQLIDDVEAFLKTWKAGVPS